MTRIHAWLAALALGLGAAPAAAQVIKIGAVLSVTGPAAFLGDPEDKTLKMYVEEINAKGGVLGRKLQLVVYDDGGDANKARTFATRLVEEDKVVAMVGGTTTGATMAMVPVFEDAEIPFISFAGAAVIVQPVKRYVFKTPHTDRMACDKIFEHMKSKGITKAGMISGTDGFGKSMRDECFKAAPALGIEMVGDETYNPADKDMTPQLTNLKNKPGIQAIVSSSFGGPAAIVTRNVKQVGITIPFYQNHGVGSKSFIELSGEAAEGVLLPAAALIVADRLPDNDPQKPIALAYKTKYEQTTRQPVSTFGGHAYDGFFILIEAMKRAGTTEPKKVRDEIEKTKGFIGTAGVFNMSPTDHNGLDLSAFKMVRIVKGDWALAE